MNAWERKVTKHLDDSEYYFLADYDRWLRAAFSQIPLGADEHTIHGFHLTVGQRLSALLAKHSIAAFTSGQAHGDEDCRDVRAAHKRKLADLPTIGYSVGKDFTPHDAIHVLKNRSIALAGDVENDVTTAVKSTLLKHLTGELSRQQAQQEIAALLKTNMDRASLIVTTETTYAYNHGRLMSYRSNGVDYVRYSAVMDGRTCQVCASRDGRIAPIDAIGGDVPPVHGRCRCVLSPVYSSLQPELLTPEALDWSRVAPTPKGWVPDDAPRAAGKDFAAAAPKNGKMETTANNEHGPYLRDRLGQMVPTEFSPASPTEVNALQKWEFGWSKEFAEGIPVYKLTVPGTRGIQGLIAAQPEPANSAYYVDLIESNPKNRGSRGRFKRVGPILMAQVCKMSFDAGYDGYVFMEAKSELVDYYEAAYGATRIGNSMRMYIDTHAARSLINRYLGGGSDEGPET